MLRYWDTQWQRSLPRPVVFCGDVSEPGLGLASSDREWIRAHCRSIIHSAASLTFQEKEEEPWKTNVKGVGNLLAFCRDVGIREFAHVSTAYVSGLRNGIVYESELDVGQEFGNDYERSKVQAEQLVRADKMLRDQLEVYRSYWRDDPVFDDTNTKSVLTDKQCPELDDEVLLRLCKFAIDSKFMMR